MRRQELDGVACWLASEGPALPLGLSIAVLFEEGLATMFEQFASEVRAFVRGRSDESDEFFEGLEGRRRLKWSASTQRRLVREIADGRLAGAGFHIYRKPQPAEGRAGATVLAASRYSLLSLDVCFYRSDVFGVDESGEWAAQHMLPMAAKLGAINAYATLDAPELYFSGMWSPYENYYMIRTSDLVRVADRVLRGYYFANLVTQKHIDRFGGLHLLRSMADKYGARVDDVGRHHWVVRADCLLSEFNNDRLAMMKTLLQGLLPDRPYWYYSGPPLRIVPEPGTATSIPPEGRRPVRFDDDPPDEDSIDVHNPYAERPLI